MILIDSNVVIDILRGHRNALAWFSSVPVSQDLMLPGYVAMELILGCRNRSDRMAVDQFIRMCEIAWINELACARALQLLWREHPRTAIGVLDVLIAQTAISLALPLYTMNVRHFKAIPDLDVIKPYRH